MRAGLAAQLRHDDLAVMETRPTLSPARYHCGECIFDAEQRRLFGTQDTAISTSLGYWKRPGALAMSRQRTWS
ncbi:hypothetical protein QPK31_01425 [Massilia sp. YIM B02769]|uniref:hypothetical protein n=1 Tax=Massilia sp. YIM B02769 TaxID=3050129 RepID=UPI0025B71D99|nr:hypothetical protein [Massilia sp. YIM B02769]MDN4056874.1 hypothetical protein [Massilia sp. YIM B02769]